MRTDKLFPLATRRSLVGYSRGFSYRIYLQSNKDVLSVRDVKFYEKIDKNQDTSEIQIVQLSKCGLRTMKINWNENLRMGKSE